MNSPQFMNTYGITEMGNNINKPKKSFFKKMFPNRPNNTHYISNKNKGRKTYKKFNFNSIKRDALANKNIQNLTKENAIEEIADTFLAFYTFDSPSESNASLPINEQKKRDKFRIEQRNKLQKDVLLFYYKYGTPLSILYKKLIPIFEKETYFTEAAKKLISIYEDDPEMFGDIIFPGDIDLYLDLYKNNIKSVNVKLVNVKEEVNPAFQNMPNASTLPSPNFTTSNLNGKTRRNRKSRKQNRKTRRN